MNGQLKKATIEQPWLKFYPKELIKAREPLMAMQGRFTLIEYLSEMNKTHDAPLIEFYGCTYSWNDVLRFSRQVGAAMSRMGVKEGDKVCAFLRAVPEYIFVLLACEMIGATLICRDGDVNENLESLQLADAKLLFAHDYLPESEAFYFYGNSKLEHIIVISPYTYANVMSMPHHIGAGLMKLSSGCPTRDQRNIDWQTFMKLADEAAPGWEASRNPNRPLCNPYTSGSTGHSKEIIHSAASMIGYISQINYPNSETGKSVLLTVFPLTLIAILNSVILFNIAQMNRLIMSPYCEPTDIDLEMQRYRPWMMMTVPMLAEILMNSHRIAPDEDLSYLGTLAGGADPVNNLWMEKLSKWKQQHNTNASFTLAYGLSECGSGVCMPCGVPFTDCFSGIPMPLCNIGVFDTETNEELDYGEIGEICIQTPGAMLGYGGRAAHYTEETLRVHPDGRKFVHSGDFGYMNEDGFVYILSRGLQRRYGYKEEYLFSLPIENKVCTVKGVKDCWSVNVPDDQHEGFFLPYLFIVPEEGYCIETLEAAVREVLMPIEQPVKIFPAEAREYWHLKLNRRGYAKRISRGFIR